MTERFYTGICPKCNLKNNTNWWWEVASGWVCYPCGMGRRDEQLKIDAKYQNELAKSKGHRLGANNNNNNGDL